MKISRLKNLKPFGDIFLYTLIVFLFFLKIGPIVPGGIDVITRSISLVSEGGRSEVFYSSWGFFVFHALLGGENRDNFIIVSISVLFIFIGLIFYVGQMQIKDKYLRRVFWISVLGSGAFVSLVHGWHTPDLLFITSGAIFAVASGIVVPVCASIIFVTSNPEQAFVSIICLILVEYGLFKKIMPSTIISILLCISFLIMFHFMGNEINSDFSRFGSIKYFYTSGIEAFFHGGAVGIYSFYGMSWLTVIYLLLSRSRHRIQNLCIVSGIILIPLCVTIVTLDQTRVFACVSFIAFIRFIYNEILNIERSELVCSREFKSFYFFMSISLLIFPSIYYRGDELAVILPGY